MDGTKKSWLALWQAVRCQFWRQKWRYACRLTGRSVIGPNAMFEQRHGNGELRARLFAISRPKYVIPRPSGFHGNEKPSARRPGRSVWVGLLGRREYKTPPWALLLPGNAAIEREQLQLLLLWVVWLYRRTKPGLLFYINSIAKRRVAVFGRKWQIAWLTSPNITPLD